MKKAYVKPELFYESFVLSQHIAACGIDVTYANEIDCTPKLDSNFWGLEDTVFNSGEARCATDISTISVYCYTTGQNEAGRLFNS